MAGRAAPWCARCGIPAKAYGDMSCVGICQICGEWAVIDNLYGLIDPQSVPYKRWKVAYQMSKPGRPANTTPTAAQLSAIAGLIAKNLIHPTS